MKRTATLAGIMLALLLLTTRFGLPTGWLHGVHGARPAVGTRQTLEVLVMAFQVVGVLALGWLKLAPGSVRAEWGMMAAQLGLGVAGASCAGFESGFALYAGFTLIVLLLGAIKTESDHAAPRHADAPRPRTVWVNG